MWFRIVPLTIHQFWESHWSLCGANCDLSARVYYVFSILHRICLPPGRASPKSSPQSTTTIRTLLDLPKITILHNFYNPTTNPPYSIALLCFTFEVFCLPDSLPKIIRRETSTRIEHMSHTAYNTDILQNNLRNYDYSTLEWRGKTPYIPLYEKDASLCSLNHLSHLTQ
jgi:hypothetical protein